MWSGFIFYRIEQMWYNKDVYLLKSQIFLIVMEISNNFADLLTQNNSITPFFCQVLVFGNKCFV